MQGIIPATWVHVDQNNLETLLINDLNHPFLAD